MSTTLLTAIILLTVASVVAALFIVMWHEATSTRDKWVAAVAGAALAVWASVAAVLAASGVLEQPETPATPPVGINLAVVLALLTLTLAASPRLRSLLSNQKNLIRLNLWRLVGIVFLVLMNNHQMPALWAWPSGIGDIIVGAAAPWVANRFDSPGGRRRATVLNLFGMADLIVAVGLGMATSPGPTQVFVTTPTSAFATHFPFALVPTFLVPLAFVLHVISLWQIVGGTWARRADGSRTDAVSR
ncbi:MAG TPA: hypothetical protein VFE12_06000 [Acetobacteraceae bacterium]|jgi:hypothetical protein|nr:hypothetical protein [Acetobacteraceae bacterium]